MQLLICSSLLGCCPDASPTFCGVFTDSHNLPFFGPMIASVTVILFRVPEEHFIRRIFLLPELRLLFPQLTGVLTLAFFIHNCIITLMKNNKHQENNVSLCHSGLYSASQNVNMLNNLKDTLTRWVLGLSGTGSVCGLSPCRADVPLCGGVDFCCFSITSAQQRLHWAGKTEKYSGNASSRNDLGFVRQIDNNSCHNSLSPISYSSTEQSFCRESI